MSVSPAAISQGSDWSQQTIQSLNSRRSEHPASFFDAMRLSSGTGYSTWFSTPPESHRQHPHLPPTGSSGLSWCWHPVCRARCTGARRPWRAKLVAGHGAGDEREPGRDARMPPGSWMGSRMAGMSAGCMQTPGDPGRGTDASPDHPAGTGPWNVAVEQSCAVSVAGGAGGCGCPAHPYPVVTLR